MTIEIRRLTPGDIDVVLAVGHLFDNEPRPDWTAAFLARDGHHMLLATFDGTTVGFITGIENLHPDKGAEMMLYELGVDEPFRLRGIGRALVSALGALARQRGCSAMWVPIEPDNVAAIATYLAAGADPPEPAATMSWALDTETS